MHYVTHGRSEETAPTVLLSAGLGGLGSYWKPQLDALGARYRVVVYDHRGTGANWEELPSEYTIANMADDVLDVLNRAGVRRCHFVGHALGGLVGIELALHAAGRLSSLVLVNAWATVDTHTRRCFEIRTALLEHGGAEAYLRAQPIFLYPAPWLSRHAERMTQEEAEGVRHFQGRHNLHARLGALLAFDAEARLGDIQVPTLIAAARDDVLVPYTRSEELARAIPTSRLALADEGGHAHSATETDRFNADLIGFFSEATHARQPH
ncbi:pyrimidine utilization protein D [Methylobacterium pseudosasicola]|uniref:Putative carbamate hydrolase RutD n=1 Tax=Methylobacterium pseudosasicola TaxID=582667 RepID=A0A1I4UPE2_9HYPH|nr:pyrimidine utilization protein D [Methylobacterium pseudosasicola]SFM90836.1 aminoacrylate hydrolase [Methylobacterium pseudosasicola]